MPWLAIASCALAVPAGARADQLGPRIGSGTSPSGQRWYQNATVFRGQLQLETSLPLDHGHDDGGGGSSFPWRSRDRLQVTQGSGFGSADEWEIDGSAYRTVAQLRVTTSDGATVTFPPRPAPRSAIRRFPPLGRYRYFVRFFPTAQAPVVVEALSPHGTVLARQRLAER